jgi:protein-tyrosine phosphatase
MLSRTRVLFVCLGNICRSPIAEGIANSIAKEQNLDIIIDSAGTSQRYENEVPCPHSIKVAKLHEIDISSLRARKVSRQDQTTFDYIVAMDTAIKEKLEALGFSNVDLLGNFSHYAGADVPDPYFFDDFEGLEEVYIMIEDCVKDFIIQKGLSPAFTRDERR